MTRSTVMILGGLILLICGVPDLRGQDEMSELRQEALGHLGAGEWEEAIEAFSRLVEQAPNDKVLWFQLGYAQHASGNHEDAIDSYDRMLAIPGLHPLNPTAMYNAACAYAMQGETDPAFERLEKAVAAGFSNTGQITSDSDLISLRADGRFGAIVEKVRRNARPCAYVEEARALDFWIGSWECYTPTGQLAGTNEITPALDDCAIEENWNGSMGMNGRSINAWDPTAGVWRQTWVSNRGNTLLFTGRVVDGAMVYERTATDSAGTVTHHRMVLNPQEDGTVTQEGKSSTDGGENWTTNWMLIYRPAES